jgi:hypothetical protein
MIKAVANLFAGVIGILILLAIIAIVIGVGYAIEVGVAIDDGFSIDSEAIQGSLILSASMVVGGVVALFSMGMACVILDIMFNIRKISENTNLEWHKGSNNVNRAEPELE